MAALSGNEASQCKFLFKRIQTNMCSVMNMILKKKPIMIKYVKLCVYRAE